MGTRVGKRLVGSAALLSAVLAIMASAEPAGLASAAARTARVPASPGWRLVTTFGKAGGSIVSEVTSNKPSDAWATGTLVRPGCSCQELLTARLDGRSWQVLRPPAPFAGTGPRVSAGTAIAGLSRSYSWTFLDRQFPDNPVMQDWALQWQNGHWLPFRLADATEITSAVVFSRSNAWGFGVRSSRAYAVHFNGRTWRRSPIPVRPQFPESTASPGPRDIWAVGPLANAVDAQNPPYALAHWTGRWRTIPFPNLTGTPEGAGASFADVVPDNSAGAWVVAVIPTGAVLLHWTGHRWVHVSLPFQISLVGSMARDGHGGLWIAAKLAGSTTCGKCYFPILHRSPAGTWSKTVVRVRNVFITSMRLIPGTRSLWAGGGIPPAAGPAVMVKFGP